jgi:release factor glutamine methyltransferase
MNTIKDVFANFKQGLSALYEPQEIEAITLMVLTEQLGLSKASIKAFPERELTTNDQEAISEILSQLTTGKPLQYVLGYAEFYGLKFLVNLATLIPRPETEELVQWVLDSVTFREFESSELSILDIGTGSGCIAISLKKNLPAANISAIDISFDALQTARKNAVLNAVDVNFMKADILNMQANTLRPQVIVSNPPYVTLEDKKRMHTNVTDFEPHTALFVPEDDPLLFYKAIADFALKNLAVDGMLFFEINESLGKETVALLADKGFKDIQLRQDMSGRDRMIKATY